VILRGYNQNDEVIKWLWEILRKLSGEDKGFFIQIWTGSPKIHPEGFSKMGLAIHKAELKDRMAFIFGQTCFNKLNLPPYESKEIFEEVIKTGIAQVKANKAEL